MWWFLFLRFGFRARDESRTLCWEDVELQQDLARDGREMFFWLNERATTTHKRQEDGHQRRSIQKDVLSNFRVFLSVAETSCWLTCGVVLCCGVGFVKCLLNLFILRHLVIATSATPRNYQILQAFQKSPTRGNHLSRSVLFFLAVRHGSRRERSEIWYMKAPLGKHQIGKLLSTAADNAGIQRVGGKFSNRSVRKTSISRLLDANTPKNLLSSFSSYYSE